MSAGPQQVDDAWQTVFTVLSSMRTTPLTAEEIMHASETLVSQLQLIDGEPKSRARHLGG